MDSAAIILRIEAIADKWEAHANYVASCYEGCGDVVNDLRDLAELMREEQR